MKRINIALRALALLIVGIMLSGALISCKPDKQDEPTPPFSQEAFNKNQTFTVAEKGGTIHSISQLNTDADPLDSHAEESSSDAWLAENFRETIIKNEDRIKSIRMKKLANGTYMLLYMGDVIYQGNFVKGIVVRFSSDMKNWSAEKLVFQDRGNTVTHNSPDAIVLSNGTIILATTVVDLSQYPNQNGRPYADANRHSIQIKTSTDNGATWSAAPLLAGQVIYQGLAWEPSFLEYKDPATGKTELHCYYTNTPPYIHRYGYFNDVRSTGSALLRSYDNGATWTPNITDKNVPNNGQAGYDPTHYDGHIVSQTSLGTVHEQHFFNDQMPVGIQLHNGSIALVMECYKFNDGEYKSPTTGKAYRHYKTSVAISHDNWAKSLALTEAGPADKYYISQATGRRYEYQVMGPYLAQFDSGEVVMTMQGSDAKAKQSLFHYIADSTGHNAHLALRPLSREITVRTWSSVLMLSSHCVAAVTANHLSSHDLSTDLDVLNTWHPTPSSSDYKAKQEILQAIKDQGHGNQIVIRNVYLNHRINANRYTMTVDGNIDEWTNSTDAFFVGGISQAQATLRTANDDNVVYMLLERLDYNLSGEGDHTEIMFSLDDGDTEYKLSIKPSGEVAVFKYNATTYEYEATTLEGLQTFVTVVGTVDDDSDEDEGYYVEISIPKTSVSMDTTAVMRANVHLYNTDKGKEFDVDEMFSSDFVIGIAGCGKIVLD